MKKLLKSKKALSPVVAAIILIAVTVAVSIAVAAWMGALTFTFMSTEQLDIQGCTFSGTNSSNKIVTMSVQNTGTSDLTVNKYKIGVSGTATALTPEVSVPQGETTTVPVPLDWSSGTTYDIYVITSTGKQFPYRATAP